MREYALVLLVAAAVTYLLTPLVRRVAVVSHAMHAPRARDTHTAPTPLLGGLAMYGGMVAGLVVASRLSFVQDPFQGPSRTEAGLILAGAFVVVVGFADDRWGLSAISKLAAQVAAAGILVWSGQALPWLPMPNGGVFSLEQDLSVTLTILLVVVTINAINFIDGLDGLAAGIVAVAALSFLAYSYTLIRTIGSTSQSLPAVSSALLAGICLGFLPHNFYPARIFMGDIGAMLLGLLLAYGPISSTDSLDPALLTNYSHTHTLDRFPTLLPLLVPAAIFIIPYADLMFAIVRRARAGKPLMAADRQHLHHRLLNIGHSYRQSVLIMYLWAALFSVTVVSLSLVRTRLAVLAAATVVAVLTLLPVTMPRLRPWRAYAKRKAAATATPPTASPWPTPAVAPQPAPAVASAGLPAKASQGVPAGASHGTPAVTSQAVAPPPDAPGVARYPTAVPPAAGPVPPSVSGAAPSSYGPFPRSPQDADPFAEYTGNGDPFPGHAQAADSFPRYIQAADPFPGYVQAADPFPGHAPAPDPFPGYAQAPDPFPGHAQDPDPFAGYAQAPDPFPGHAQDADPFAGYAQDANAFAGYREGTDPFVGTGPLPGMGSVPDATPFPGDPHSADAVPFPGDSSFPSGPWFPADPLPRAGRLPDAAPFDPAPFPGQGPGQSPFPSQPPFPGQGSFPDEAQFPGQPPVRDQKSFRGAAPFPGPAPFEGPGPFPAAVPPSGDDPVDGDGPDPFSPAQHPDVRPR
jgi:UDP-GlcNAc:undecaprenyl-phosphate/decaprenyl-phosphate GlcNAc-1-phosphate transferase